MFYHIKLPQKYVILLSTQNASCKSYICTKVHSYQSLNIDISKIFNIILFFCFFFLSVPDSSLLHVSTNYPQCSFRIQWIVPTDKCLKQASICFTLLTVEITLFAIIIPLSRQSGHCFLQLVHFSDERVVGVFELVLVIQTACATCLCVAAVLQCASTLFQPAALIRRRWLQATVQLTGW